MAWFSLKSSVVMSIGNVFTVFYHRSLVASHHNEARGKMEQNIYQSSLFSWPRRFTICLEDKNGYQCPDPLAYKSVGWRYFPQGYDVLYYTVPYSYQQWIRTQVHENLMANKIQSKSVHTTIHPSAFASYEWRLRISLCMKGLPFKSKLNPPAGLFGCYIH